MTTTHEALREAVEALKGMLALDEENHQRAPGDEDVCKEAQAAYAAIHRAEEALKQPAEWVGLDQQEKAQFVDDICEYGTGFVAPLFATVESIEAKLREKNSRPAAQPPQA